jgi:hypothetical protein
MDTADASEAESTSPPLEDEREPEAKVPPSPPPNRMKIDALRRLRALERRGKTVGTHLDELRELLTQLFELLPD